MKNNNDLKYERPAAPPGRTVSRRNRAQSVSRTGPPQTGRTGSSGRTGTAGAYGKAVTGRPERNRTQVISTERAAESEEQLHQQRRRQRRELQKERRARAVRNQKIAIGFITALFLVIIVVGGKIVHKAWATSTLSDDVLAYKDTVELYAEQEGIEEYVDVLLAIMMVESEGDGEDVMQSSESKGLERNSLSPEESIEQACIYFSALVEIAGDLGIDDDKALIQAYNFGPGYLDYLAENGKKHRQKLAIEYAKEQSGGEKIRYPNLYAIRKNGGWIYKFGNMFYDAIVQRYL